MILYISFIYMVIHLTILAFKKGQSIRVGASNYSSPMTDERYLMTTSIRIKRMKIGFKSLYSKKHKLMNQEIKKSYAEPFSQELVEVMATKRFVKEIYDELVTVFDIKEYNEYKNHSFNDDLKKSRRVQFYDVVEKVYIAQNQELVNILKVMYEKEFFIEVEKDEWIEKLKEIGELPGEKPVKVEFLSELYKEEKPEEPVEIMERAVPTQRAERF